MKNIKISILCTIILATATYCPEPNIKEKKQKTNTTLVQKISDSKKPSSKLEDKPLTISERIHNFAHRRITVKEGVLFAITSAMLLVLIITIKSDLFPSDEPKAIRDFKKSSLRNINMSLWLLSLYAKDL